MKKLVLTLAALAALTTPIIGREGYEDRPLICNPGEMGTPEALKLCRAWISGVKRPDNPPDMPNRTCCGEADAFLADAFVERDGKYYAVVTEEYPDLVGDDGEGGSYTIKGVKKGTEVLIPPEKLNRAMENGGNPSGHGIVFMRGGSEVLCYFGPTLS